MSSPEGNNKENGPRHVNNCREEPHSHDGADEERYRPLKAERDSKRRRERDEDEEDRSYRRSRRSSRGRSRSRSTSRRPRRRRSSSSSSYSDRDRRRREDGDYRYDYDRHVEPHRNRNYDRHEYDHRRHHDRRLGRPDRDAGGPPRDSDRARPRLQQDGRPRPAPLRRPVQEYRVVDAPKDEQLGDVKDDPRGEDPTQRITKKASSRGAGRNTESFDPASTLVRPDLRIQLGSNRIPKYNKPLKHDDVVIVPELFGAEDDWTMYYQLVKEMRDIQAEGNVKGAEWISWHEGAHLICKNPTASPTFTKIVDRLCEYFNIRKESIGTRFNWYKDSSDWKPFHHDSAAFNPQRAKNQNITVGVSFGAARELAFIRAEPMQNQDKVRLYFPQCNNGVFSFGRDANILWKHGINALPPDEQDGKGRISIILWGLAQDAIEEIGSPPLLGSDGRGPHANKGQHNNNRGRNRSKHRGGGGQNNGGGRRNEKRDGRLGSDRR